ncbi:10684_t:CDS:2, partial [Racocetra persica]
FNEEDDVDLTTYFEEIIYCNEDLNDIHNNLEPVPLKGDSFNTFDEAELHMAESDKVVRKRTILCKHSSSFKPKNNPNFLVFVTTFNDEHNYDLFPEAIRFEKNKRFTEEMRKEVEFLVTKCHLSATMVRRILKENVVRSDASQFYGQLLSKQQEDSHWFVEITWEEETNTLTNLFWMSPEQILLW